MKLVAHMLQMCSITDGQLYVDALLFGTGTCPAVSVDKSVSRVGAKALDVVWRSVAFRLYSLLNEYKQELEAVVKSRMFVIRAHRWSRTHVLFVQRSPFLCYWNVLILFSCVHGMFDIVAVRLLKLVEYTLVRLTDILRLSYVCDTNVFASNWGCYELLRVVGMNYSLISIVDQSLRIHVLVLDKYTAILSDQRDLSMLLDTVMFLTTLTSFSSDCNVSSVSHSLVPYVTQSCYSVGIYISSIL